jgi:hypothetical protein
MGRVRLGSVAAAVSSAALLAAGAWAQTAKDETVLGRPRPDYSPIGVEIGGGGLFTLYPKVTVGAIFDDNVYREEHNRNADVAALVQPELHLRSDWDAHALGAGAVATIVRYRDEVNAGYEDWSAYADGRLDITDDLAASAFAEWARLHEDRGDPSTAAADQDSIEFDRFTRRLALDYRGSPIFGRVSGEWASFDYHDNNGFNYDDRDYDFYEARLRVGAEVTPSVSAFVEPGYNWRVYDGLDDFGFDRDSHGYDVRVGVTYDVTAVTYLEAFGGYFRQTYDDARFETTDGFAAGVEATWNPNDVTTVTGTISRRIRETAIADVSAIRDTGLDLRVDYEVLENLVASAHGSLHEEHFHGIGRDDNVRTLGAGLTYFINPYFQAGLDYTFGERNSHVDGEGYRYNAVVARLTGAL